MHMIAVLHHSFCVQTYINIPVASHYIIVNIVHLTTICSYSIISCILKQLKSAIHPAYV